MGMRRNTRKDHAFVRYAQIRIVSIALGGFAGLLTACASPGPGGKRGSDDSRESGLSRVEQVAFMNRPTERSFDDLVRAQQQRLRDRDSECIGGL
jgi:hypothetical protein